jgi:predicted transcriptional regulator
MSATKLQRYERAGNVCQWRIKIFWNLEPAGQLNVQQSGEICIDRKQMTQFGFRTSIEVDHEQHTYYNIIADAIKLIHALESILMLALRSELYYVYVALPIRLLFFLLLTFTKPIARPDRSVR